MLPSRPIEEMVLITHQAVVDTLPASIRGDFEEPDAGELWRLPRLPRVPISWAEGGWIGEVRPRTSWYDRTWVDVAP